jgi:hypothetical protein
MPWEFVGKSTNYTKVCAIHRLYTTLHKIILGFADIGSMEKFFWFFSVSSLIYIKFKIKYRIERENTRFVSFLLYKSLLVCSEHEKHRLLIFNYWRSGIIQYIQSEIYNNLKCLFRHHQLYICIFPSHISIMNCVWSLIFFKMSLFSPNLIEIRFWAKKKSY